MSEIVGYKLIDNNDGSIVEQWGGIYGQCPGVPDYIDCPNGDRVFCPQLDVVYGGGVKLVRWYMDPPPPVIPSFITLAQARRQLRVLDLFAQVDGAANADPASAACDAWNYGNGVTRGGVLANLVQQTLGWNDVQMDDFMVAAAAIQL